MSRVKTLGAVMMSMLAITSKGQTLDESLMSASDDQNASIQWAWEDKALGDWLVWVEVDAGTLEELQGQTTNNLRDAALIGQPDWDNNKLTNTLNRMNNGFDNVVDNWGRYIPNHIRLGASRTLDHNLSLGMQVGKVWTRAYVDCLNAEGEEVVASWDQVRHAELMDQFLYYDNLYNGNLWEFGNSGTFSEGLEAWSVEVCAAQEVAYGLGWSASVGTTVGLEREMTRLASSFSGAKGQVSPNESGATLSPQSMASQTWMTSLGATYRLGAIQFGAAWSNQMLGTKGMRNALVASGAEDIQPIQKVRLRLGMTF